MSAARVGFALRIVRGILGVLVFVFGAITLMFGGILMGLAPDLRESLQGEAWTVAVVAVVLACVALVSGWRLLSAPHPVRSR